MLDLVLDRKLLPVDFRAQLWVVVRNSAIEITERVEFEWPVRSACSYALPVVRTGRIRLCTVFDREHGGEPVMEVDVTGPPVGAWVWPGDCIMLGMKAE